MPVPPPGVTAPAAPARHTAAGRDGAFDELPDDIDSPYAIRGRK